MLQTFYVTKTIGSENPKPYLSRYHAEFKELSRIDFCKNKAHPKAEIEEEKSMMNRQVDASLDLEKKRGLMSNFCMWIEYIHISFVH